MDLGICNGLFAVEWQRVLERHLYKRGEIGVLCPLFILAGATEN